MSVQDGHSLAGVVLREGAARRARGGAAPPAPRAGRRAQPRDYLDPVLIAAYAQEAAERARLYAGNAARLAHEVSTLIDAWYNAVYSRRDRAYQRGQLAAHSVRYPGGSKAFRTKAWEALRAQVPDLPPAPAPAQQRRRPLLPPPTRR